MPKNNFSTIATTLLLLSLAVGMTACKKSVTRTDANAVTDLSGKWNDTDSRLVSQEMIQDVLSRAWLKKYMKKHKGNAPTVIVGKVRNLSHEHINTRTFIADMEKALINSGEVEFVASSSERKEIRGERRDQDINSSESTRKAMGNEIGADYMLKGTINTIIDAIAGEQARFYQIDLTLIDLENNRKVWVGQKKIKKVIEKSGIRW